MEILAKELDADSNPARLLGDALKSQVDVQFRCVNKHAQKCTLTGKHTKVEDHLYFNCVIPKKILYKAFWSFFFLIKWAEH